MRPGNNSGDWFQFRLAGSAMRSGGYVEGGCLVCREARSGNPRFDSSVLLGLGDEPAIDAQDSVTKRASWHALTAKMQKFAIS